MRRRSALLGFCGFVSMAGCLTQTGNEGSQPTESPGSSPDGTRPTDRSDEKPTSADSTGRRFEECSRGVIPYEQFPPAVRTEIDAARDGRYEASRIYLREAMDVTGSYVSVADTYYDPVITTDGATEVLTLRRVDPKALPSARPVSVEHHLDGERIVTVEVVADDGTVLLDTTLDLWPGGAVEFGRTARVGTHDFRITVARGDEVSTEVTKPIRVCESLSSVHFVVDSDGVRASQGTTDPPACHYDS